MKALRVSCIAFVVAVASLVTGCGTQFAATELNAAAPLRASRPASSVDVFASAPPTRPHVDVRIIEAVPGWDRSMSIVDDLRAEAGREGCDAIYVRSVALPLKPSDIEHASATCIVYTDSAPAAAPPPADAAVSSNAVKVGAILRAD